MNNTEKTAVSLLQECCDQKKFTAPVYELIHNGINTDGLFTYMVRVNSYTSKGSAHSKKSAKQEAAKNLLCSLKMGCSQLLPDLIKHNTESPVKVDDYVSQLFNECKTRMYNEPEFIETGLTGPPHNPLFSMECRVGNFKVTGSDKSKKAVKNKTAQMMLDIFKEVSLCHFYILTS